MRYELRALGVGGILDQSIRILKDRFGLFLPIALAVQLPITLAASLFLNPTMAGAQFGRNATPEEALAVALSQLWTLSVLIPLMLIWSFTVGTFAYAAIVHSAARIYLGRESGFRDAMKVAARRYSRCLWTSFLYFLIVTLGMLFCVLPGILFLFWYALAVNVSVLEASWGTSALNRSHELMRKGGIDNYLTLFLLWLVVGSVNIGINSAVGLIPERHVAAALGGLLQSVQLALMLISTVVFYYSTRCRAENFDLLWLAQAVAREAPPAEEAVKLE